MWYNWFRYRSSALGSSNVRTIWVKTQLLKVITIRKNPCFSDRISVPTYNSNLLLKTFFFFSDI